MSNTSENNQDYSWSEIYFIINKHINKILITFFAVFFFISFYTFIVKSTYQSTGVVMVSDEQNSMSILDMSLLGSDLNFIENEIEILKSRSTAELVINRLFDSEYRDSLFLLKTKKYKSNKIRNLLTLGLLDNFQTLINYDEAILSDSLLNIFSDELRENVNVSNKRNTDAISISYTSNSPFESALIWYT